jgi:uncharacterized DUF497 family protein
MKMKADNNNNNNNTRKHGDLFQKLAQVLVKFSVMFGTRSFNPFLQELATTAAALAAAIIIIIIIINLIQ